MTIFFVFVTVLVFLQLRSVLGRKTGNEKPFSNFWAVHDGKISAVSSKEGSLKLVSLEKEKSRDNFDAIDADFPIGTPLNKSLREIVSIYPDFNPQGFLSGVRDAYEKIVVSFYEGNIQNIKELIDEKVYKDFSAAIAKQAESDKNIKSSLVGIEDVKIVRASVKDGGIHVVTRIVGQYISASYDKEGAFIPGDPEFSGKVIDRWTFTRKTPSKNPNWKLVSTEPGN
ncbi:Tim44/TimA family putative adaptor protein [Candidatus Liberibacter sp.]|uniref:Tim44/TimA family putative adaptor protein n=1 Tax=Candidatus Liberibacter sp. TaxID=34022 RepID=UPI00217564F0|nr:Tim44/TimA family putative adaptor protein [Candidatus Liberibacter sp.]